MVDGNSLENCRGVKAPRGFESHPLRFLFIFLYKNEISSYSVVWEIIEMVWDLGNRNLEL